MGGFNLLVKFYRSSSFSAKLSKHLHLHLHACVWTEMNADLDYGGSGSSGNGKLRQWLIEQVDCGKYPGLVWENDEKTIFRIPWKHAGKQDYNRDEDAALFKVRHEHRILRCPSSTSAT